MAPSIPDVADAVGSLEATLKINLPIFKDEDTKMPLLTKVGDGI